MTAALPLVSIGLPVLNAEKKIMRALEALLAQTYLNFEIVVSDNCSSDKTAQICKAYAEKDNRIKLSINKKDLGIIANFKIVHKKANGKYFMWAGADDYWEPEFIKTLVNALESDPMAGVAQCAVRRVNPNGSLKDIIRFDEKHNRSRLSHWQIAFNLLSPNKQIVYQKYNLFIYGLFRHEAISEAFKIENEIFNYKERALLVLVALAYKFRYVDEVLFSKTVNPEPFSTRYPNDQYTQSKKDTGYLNYWWAYYNKLIICITRYSKIPLQRKPFVLFFSYWMVQRFFYKQKKRLRKALYGKNGEHQKKESDNKKFEDK